MRIFGKSPIFRRPKPSDFIRRFFHALKCPKIRENGGEKEALDDALQRVMWYLKITRCFPLIRDFCDKICYYILKY